MQIRSPICVTQVPARSRSRVQNLTKSSFHSKSLITPEVCLENLSTRDPFDHPQMESPENKNHTSLCCRPNPTPTTKELRPNDPVPASETRRTHESQRCIPTVLRNLNSHLKSTRRPSPLCNDRSVVMTTPGPHKRGVQEEQRFRHTLRVRPMS